VVGCCFNSETPGGRWCLLVQTLKQYFTLRLTAEYNNLFIIHLIVVRHEMMVNKTSDVCCFLCYSNYSRLGSNNCIIKQYRLSHSLYISRQISLCMYVDVGLDTQWIVETVCHSQWIVETVCHCLSYSGL